MRIAICISGQPRYLEEGYFFINKYLSNYDVDFFIHTWWDESYVGNDFLFTNIERDSRYDKDTINKITKYYKPKGLIIEKQKKFEISNDVDYGGLHPLSTYSMFYSIKCSNGLKKKYEYENDFKYDLVIRTRFDIVINHFNLNLKDLDSDYFYLGGEIHRGGQINVPNDQFCISSSKNMDYYSDLYDNLENYIKEGHRVIVGEQLLKYHLITKGNKKVYFTDRNELLTNAWWQFSKNDCNCWNNSNAQETITECINFKNKLNG